MAAWGPNCWWRGAPITASRCEFVPHSQKPRSPFPRLHAIKHKVSPKELLATGASNRHHTTLFFLIKKSHFQKPGHAQFSLPLTSHPLPQGPQFGSITQAEHSTPVLLTQAALL